MRSLVAVILIAAAAPAIAAGPAPQLPHIDAGSIWAQINNQHNPFPQPQQTTLDYCTLTDMKNNKWYFKCKSGAVLIEPAVKPDFPAGEPAGPCATMIIRPMPAGTLPTKAAANWTDAAKAAFEKALDEGGLTDYAETSETPPGVRRQLEQELNSLPQGPGNEAEVYKMMVNGRTAFVVQSYIHDDSMRVHLFNAAGVKVAYGEGSVDKDFAWLPL
ncbi:MAG: hypothetical protein M0011_12770 [Elusimicrobia bacterium]|nr:hypothetical protein [Elusimicrobiota bacterium]